MNRRSSFDIDARLASGARLLWVCAHPDDEFLTGGLLARAAIHHGAPVHIVVLTRGEGGSNHIDAPDLAAARKTEMEAVAAKLGVTVEIHDFYNAGLPASSFPPREEILRRWRDHGDPDGIIEDAIRRFDPDLVITFEPTFGATGHPEHQLVSRLTTAAAARVAADGGPTPEVYYALRKHWFFRLLNQTDPGPVDGWFDGGMPCGNTGRTCQQMLVELTYLHRTQEKDMGMFRRFSPFFRKLGLRRADPANAPAPEEPAPPPA